MELEKKGVPTVTVSTPVFERLAHSIAKNLGMPDLAVITVSHPIGGAKAEEVTKKAEEGAGKVIAAMLGAPVEVAPQAR